MISASHGLHVALSQHLLSFFWWTKQTYCIHNVFNLRCPIYMRVPTAGINVLSWRDCATFRVMSLLMLMLMTCSHRYTVSCRDVSWVFGSKLQREQTAHCDWNWCFSVGLANSAQRLTELDLLMRCFHVQLLHATRCNKCTWNHSSFGSCVVFSGAQISILLCMLFSDNNLSFQNPLFGCLLGQPKLSYTS